jgi:hypothetical protein
MSFGECRWALVASFACLLLGCGTHRHGSLKPSPNRSSRLHGLYYYDLPMLRIAPQLHLLIGRQSTRGDSSESSHCVSIGTLIIILPLKWR